MRFEGGVPGGLARALFVDEFARFRAAISYPSRA